MKDEARMIRLHSFPDNPVRSWLVELAESIQHYPDVRDRIGSDCNAGDALYLIVIESIAAYVECWAEMGPGDLVDVVVSADDLDDPDRIADPEAGRRESLLAVLLEDMDFHVRGSLGLSTAHWEEEASDD
jgi:hypothetical protein